MLKQVHDELLRFRNKHSLSFHGASPEMPLFRVIPNLFRDLGVDLIQGRVHDLGRVTEDGSSQRTAGSPLLSEKRFLCLQLGTGE